MRVLEEMLDCTTREAKDSLKLQEREFLRTHIHEQRTLVPEDAVRLLESHLSLSLDPTLRMELADAL